MLVVYKISLPQNQDTKAFVAFMRKEYLPATTGPTRVGGFHKLVLNRRLDQPEASGTEFQLQLEWSGVSEQVHLGLGDASARVAARWLEFGATLERLGSYEACFEDDK